MSETSKKKDNQQPPKSAVPPRGSKKVHSEKDDSTKDGFKPNKSKK